MPFFAIAMLRLKKGRKEKEIFMNPHSSHRFNPSYFTVFIKVAKLADI